MVRTWREKGTTKKIWRIATNPMEQVGKKRRRRKSKRCENHRQYPQSVEVQVDPPKMASCRNASNN